MTQVRIVHGQREITIDADDPLADVVAAALTAWHLADHHDQAPDDPPQLGFVSNTASYIERDNLE